MSKKVANFDVGIKKMNSSAKFLVIINSWSAKDLATTKVKQREYPLSKKQDLVIL